MTSQTFDPKTVIVQVGRWFTQGFTAWEMVLFPLSMVSKALQPHGSILAALWYPVVRLNSIFCLRVGQKLSACRNAFYGAFNGASLTK